MVDGIRVRCALGHFCDMLSDALEMNNSTSTGLVALNKKRGFARRFGVMYYANERTPGRRVNFCPFCGTDLRLLEQ